MPRLVRFLVFHAGIGFALALASVIAIFWFNIANLNELILSSDYKWIAIFALVILMTITLASVQMGIAIMCLPYEPENDDADGPTYLRQSPVQRSPVRIPVETDEDLPLRVR